LEYYGSLYPDLSKMPSSSMMTGSSSSANHWSTMPNSSNSLSNTTAGIGHPPLVSLASNEFSSVLDFGNNQALIFNAQSSQNRSPQPSGQWNYPHTAIQSTAVAAPTGLILQPILSNPYPISNSLTLAERDQLLAMFDPLCPSPVSSSTTSSNSSSMGSAVHAPQPTPATNWSSSATPRQPVAQIVHLPPTQRPMDPQTAIEEVHRRAIFTTRERCANALKRCSNDVERAVRELKIEKLLDLGLVSDRHHAENTLATVAWDVNAAAEKLLS